MGVAPGGVTITATVTKGSETGNVGSQLTVMGPQVGEKAFILVASIESENPETTGLKGRVDVQANVERGDQVLEGLTLLVDGDVVDSQNFGVAATPEVEEPAAQAIHSFTLSFDSDDHDSSTGSPAYMNGDHEISMQLKVAGSEAISSNVLTVEFNNDDGYVVTADLGDNSAVSDDGQRWYGGPSNGMIEFTALPVSYSGASITSVSGDFCGKDVTDAEAPFMLSFECTETSGETGEMLTVSSGGTDGMILNMADLPLPAFVDFDAPMEPPMILANRNGREDGWINMYVGLTGEFDAKDEKDNWLAPGKEGEGGVGGYNMMVRVGGDLEKAVAASPSSMLPAESKAADSYCAVASATDDLGNETELPDPEDEDATCRTAPAGADALVDHDMDMLTPDVYGHDETPDNDMDAVADVSGQTLEFGVDTTAPTVVFGDDYDDANRHDDIPDAFAFEPEDDESNVGNSGLDVEKGLLVGLQRRTASKTECLAIGDDGTVAGDAEVDEDCKMVGISDEDVTLATGVAAAYYTLSGTAQDKAGNRSDAISHVFAYDAGAATATAPAVPGVIEAGKSFEGASFLNDNLSIRDYYGTADFGAIVSLGIGLPIGVDEFNAASLTNRNHVVSATVGIHTSGGVLPPYAALQNTVGGNLQLLSGVSVSVRDQTQAAGDQTENYSTESSTFSVMDAPGTDDDFDSGAFTTDWAGRTDANVYEFCGLAVCDDEDLDTSVKIEVMAIAPAAGTFSNPFERVDFWVTDVNGASWMVGSDISGGSGRVGGDEENARWRTWSYSVTLPGTMLNMATRGVTGGTGDAMFRAIGVNEEGVGLVVSTGVTINVMKP